MICPNCGREWKSSFCPICNPPKAPYITQRQQDHQGCPFCGSTRIQVFRETVVKRRWFRKTPRERNRLIRKCADCGRRFR